MTVRTATFQDLDLLVSLRMAFIEEEWSDDHVGLAALPGTLYAYFERHLNRDLIVSIAEDGQPAQQVALSTAFLVILDRPPNPTIPSGCTGMIVNVYTLPAFRRQGLATTVISHLLEEARKRDVTRVDLAANNHGQPVYEKLGFKPSPYVEMQLSL